MGARRRVIELEIEIEKLKGALIWCSGSADFAEGGKAREGWLKLCKPLLKEMKNDEQKSTSNTTRRL